MRNECTDKVTKFGGAARRRFYAVREKPEGGAPGAPPPPEIGLTHLAAFNYNFLTDSLLKPQ